jgi:DNA-binding NarL/FixJ family response regulator
MLRVLLVDNHVFVRGGLRTLLRARRDFAICGEASNGQDGIKLAIQAKPDVVVMGVPLPDINGIEATRQIRKASPDTEVLIFTADSNGQLMRQALHAGARAYLPKSASDEQIIGTIEALAQHQRYAWDGMVETLLDHRSAHKRGANDEAELTGREQQVLRLIAEGHRTRDVALLLGISHRTVDAHRASTMRKLKLRSIAEVVRYAIRERLIKA